MEDRDISDPQHKANACKQSPDVQESSNTQEVDTCIYRRLWLLFRVRVVKQTPKLNNHARTKTCIIITTGWPTDHILKQAVIVPTQDPEVQS